MTPNDPLDVGGGALAGLDRRGNLRRPLRVAARLVIAGQSLTARTIDIGAHGLSVSVDRNLPARTDCEVTFTMPVRGQSHPMTLHARVVHGVLSGSQGFKLGLELLQTSLHDDQLIEQYVAR